MVEGSVGFEVGQAASTVGAWSVVMATSLERPRLADRRGLPESSGKVARCALPKGTPGDPGDPGELRTCPKVAEKLPGSCRTVPPGAEIWPEVGQHSVIWSKFRTIRARRHQMLANLTHRFISMLLTVSYADVDPA